MEAVAPAVGTWGAPLGPSSPQVSHLQGPVNKTHTATPCEATGLVEACVVEGPAVVLPPEPALPEWALLPAPCLGLGPGECQCSQGLLYRVGHPRPYSPGCSLTSGPQPFSCWPQALATPNSKPLSVPPPQPCWVCWPVSVKRRRGELRHPTGTVPQGMHRVLLLGTEMAYPPPAPARPQTQEDCTLCRCCFCICNKDFRLLAWACKCPVGN